MSAKQDIEKRIEKEQARINELKNQIGKSEGIIQGLQEALRLMLGVNQTTVTESNKTSRIRSGSDIQKAIELLRQNASPMHLLEILKGIGKDNTPQNRASLASSLYRAVNSGKVKKIGSAIFTSLEYNSSEIKETIDLPPDFGKTE